jgi:hypothetical protein
VPDLLETKMPSPLAPEEVTVPPVICTCAWPLPVVVAASAVDPDKTEPPFMAMRAVPVWLGPEIDATAPVLDACTEPALITMVALPVPLVPAVCAPIPPPPLAFTICPPFNVTWALAPEPPPLALTALFTAPVEVIVPPSMLMAANPPTAWLTTDTAVPVELIELTFVTLMVSSGAIGPTSVCSKTPVLPTAMAGSFRVSVNPLDAAYVIPVR